MMGTSLRLFSLPNGAFRVLASVYLSHSHNFLEGFLILSIRELVAEADMEHGSFKNDSQASFTITEEDHTLANAVRFVLNQDPRVTMAGYTIPHPSLERVTIPVQTTGEPAREVFKDACQELMLMNRHVRSVFIKAVAEYKAEESLKKQRDQIESMNIESN